MYSNKPKGILETTLRRTWPQSTQSPCQTIQNIRVLGDSSFQTRKVGESHLGHTAGDEL